MTRPPEDDQESVAPAEQPDGLTDDDMTEDDLDDEYRPGFDWPVFLGRAAGLVLIGAVLISAVDLSFNRGLDWLDIFRVCIQPMAVGVVVLLLAEILDRQGD